MSKRYIVASVTTFSTKIPMASVSVVIPKKSAAALIGAT